MPEFDYDAALTPPPVPEEYAHCIQGTWSVGPDGLVNVEGSVNLGDLSLTELPIRFGHVSGDFYCSHNQLQSLEGAPQTVGRDFHCSHNQLQSLEGAPQTVGGGFSCSHNQLQSLEGAPQSVGWSFDCSHNQLQSLEGAPQSVGGGFGCDAGVPGLAGYRRRVGRA